MQRSAGRKCFLSQVRCREEKKRWRYSLFHIFIINVFPSRHTKNEKVLWWQQSLMAARSFAIHRTTRRGIKKMRDVCRVLRYDLSEFGLCKKKKKKKAHKKHQPSLGVILWYSQDKPVSVNASGWVVGMLPLHYITHRHSVWFMDLRVWKNELFTSLHLNPFLKWNRRYKTFLSELHLVSNLYHGTKTYYDLRFTRPFLTYLHNKILCCLAASMAVDVSANHGHKWVCHRLCAILIFWQNV